MLFKEYKCIGFDRHIDTLKKLGDLNIGIVGPSHSGKLTLALAVFPNAFVVDDLDSFKETSLRLHNSILDNCVVCFKNVCKTGPLVSIVERCSNVKFVFTSHTALPHKLSSLLYTYRLGYPSLEEKKTVCNQLGLVVPGESFKSFHDVLIFNTLVNHNLDPDELYEWKEHVYSLCACFHKMDILEIREILYRLFVNALDMQCVLYIACSSLCNLYPQCLHDIYHYAGYYSHTMALGNKCVYHLEAFLLDAKKVILPYVDPIQERIAKAQI